MDIHPRIVLYSGVVGVTTSSFIIRYADSDAFTLAGSRLLLTGILSLTFSLFFTYPKIQYSNRDKGLMFIAGISLTSHFALWFDSLNYLNIGISLALTNTGPIWLIIISSVIYHTKPTKKHLLSILLVAFGSSVLFLGSYSGQINLVGLLLALGSAVGLAIYLMVAKELVEKIGLWRYFGIVNTIAGFSILPYLILFRSTTILIPRIWIFGLILAIFPGMMGHAFFNYAMSKINSVDVIIATLGEPILGTIFAYLIFKEELGVYEIIGMGILLLAIVFTTGSESVTNEDL